MSAKNESESVEDGIGSMEELSGGWEELSGGVNGRMEWKDGRKYM